MQLFFKTPIIYHTFRAIPNQFMIVQSQSALFIRKCTAVIRINVHYLT